MALSTPVSKEPVRLVRPADQPTTGPLAGDPGMLGLPSFIIGTVALGLIAIGVLPNAPTNAALPILLAATSTGLFLATIWAVVARQSAAAGIYGVFGGFFLSYALLQLGMAHNWFGIGPVSYADTAKTFLICWMVVITVMILATLRLPLVFTALFTLVDVTLLLDLLQVIRNSTGLEKATGWSALAVAAVGIYMYIGSGFHATGGKGLPQGKPILHA